MHNMIARAVLSIVVMFLIWIVGYLVIHHMIAIEDISIALIYVGGVIGGGCFWIGSRP